MKGRNVICLVHPDGTFKGRIVLQDVPDVKWTISGFGDFNNDGMPDIFWRHYGNGNNGIWFMNQDLTINRT